MSAERIVPPGPRATLAKACSALKVFPLHGVAILPGTPTPLHVFEPRYKALVEDALAGDRMLAIPSLLVKSDAHATRPPLRQVCGAGVIEAEERYPDGRFDIVVRGLARVRLVEELGEGKPYREWKARILEDVWPPRGPGALAGQLDALRQIVLELSQRLPSESGAPQLAEAVSQMKDPSAIVDLVAAAAVSDAGARQKVLEELDVAARLAYVMEEVAGVVLVLSRGKNPRV
jgi:Lon protease-like protein